MIVAVTTTVLSSLIVVNDVDKDLLWEGLGGLDAVGGNRLLYDYPNTTRDEIMDLLFSKQVGAQWQILKQEINGDSQSSYGSGSSFEHMRGDIDPNRWNRGTHHLLLKEALKRNPEIPLYALSWGVPHWVGNGTFYSEDNIQYHIRYLKGMKEHYAANFNYLGIWNEVSYSSDYIIRLREALDDAGLSTEIVASDESNTNIVQTMLSNSSVMKAVAVVGVHRGEMDSPVANISELIAANKKRFWNSETNVIDGAYPKWDGMALPWVRQQLRDYLTSQSTATILCPITHSWSMNYGRNNHGHSTFIEPWSGYYILGAPFWTQAHLTHFTEVGRSSSSQWFFLKNASHSISAAQSTVTGAVLFKPSTSDLTIIAVNEGDEDYSFTASLEGVFSKWRGGNLSVRQSTAADWFKLLPSVSIPQSGDLQVKLLANSVTTLSTLSSPVIERPKVPERFQFPLPFHSDFQDRVLGGPGKYFCDQYGAFDVSSDPTNSSNNVLRQSAMANPGNNGWKARPNLDPFTGLPSGTNWANYKVSVKVLFPDESGFARLCGRVPLWSPEGGQVATRSSIPFGVCLTVYFGGGWNITSYQLSDPVPRLLGSGKAVTVAVTPNRWYSLSLTFVDDSVILPPVFHTDPLSLQSRLFTGIAGVGSSWGHIYFDDFSLELAGGYLASPPKGFLMDCLAGDVLGPEFTGQVGMVVEVTKNVTVTQLGRFRVPGNKDTHSLTIVSARSNETIITEPAFVKLDGCTPDINGFCYAAPATNPTKLVAGERYYIVSSEVVGGDTFLDMTNPATGTTMHNRDGTTYLSHRIPDRILVVGKVLIPSHPPSQPKVYEMIDVSYGPLNFVTLE